MNNLLPLLVLLSLSGLALTPTVFAQDNEPAPPSSIEAVETLPEEEISASQEVEITEDNYRQFMELKDAMRQRDVIPENVFKPGSGLQKLDKLPEESQKHLRNQLREIIVQGDPWQPGDEETQYPYKPSAEASTNPALEKQELEAWGELVDSYHERESQIYENSSGTQAARGSEQGSNNSNQNGMGSGNRQGENGQGSQGQQVGQEGNPDQSKTEGTYSLSGSSASSTDGTSGVSQNAMEFLRGLGKVSNNTGQAPGDGSEKAGVQEDSATASSEQAQQQPTQIADSEQTGASGSSTQGAPQNPSSESTAGTSQNAMEFLQGDPGQAGESGKANNASLAGNEGQSEQESEPSESSVSTIPPAASTLDSPAESDMESTAGASQNALQYLTNEIPQTGNGDNNEAAQVQPEGTLSIQDLLNARGVGDATITVPAEMSTGNDKQIDEDKPKNDTDGD